MKKTVIGFSRDHSGSMRHIAHAALKDYNKQIQTIKETSVDQDVIVSVVTIGVGLSPSVGVEVQNSSVQALKPLTTYEADANGTPMIASVHKLIDIFEAMPDATDPDVSFLIMVTTDGAETVNRASGPALARKIKMLQATDRWTFVFRVPKGGGRELETLGINNVNVLEWDQTTKGVEQSTQANVEAFTEYFKGRSSGMRSTTRFYANLQDVTVEDLKTELTDISSEVKFLNVFPSEGGMQIRDFVENRIKEPMMKGGAFYELVKLEPKVQDNKRIAIMDKNSGAIYVGCAARKMLGLPTTGTVRLAPDELGNYKVYIQSTSVNRKVDANTQIMYWRNIGTAFKAAR